MMEMEEVGLEGGKRSLPNGWKWVKLGDVCEIIMGQSPVGSSYNSNREGEPLLNGPTEFGLVHPTPIQWTNIPTRFAEPGDILFCVRGATTGRKNMADQRYCIGRGLAAIRGKLKQADNSFLYFLLDAVTVEILRETAGSTFPNLQREKLENFKIPLPPLDEQNRIAGILNEKMEAVEKARESAIAQLEAAKALTAAYLRSVFNSPEARKTSSDGWKWVKLGDVCEINPSRPRNLKRGDEELTSFVPMSAVDGKLGIIANSEIKKFATVRKGYTYFAKGDVLFAKITPCMENGKHAIAKNLIDDIGFGTTEFHVIRPGDKITSDWVHKFVRQPEVCKKASNFFIGSVGQQRVPAEFLVNIKIPLPPLDEQKRIATILNEKLTEAEKLCKVLEEQLENINKLPAAFLRQAFNGEL